MRTIYRKFILVAAVAAIMSGAAVTIMVWPAEPTHFTLDAVYENGTIHVTYADDSDGTTGAALEVLGMAQTLHRVYDGPFQDVIPFGEPPRYGWGAHPVIVTIYHETLGHIILKTEVYSMGQPPAPLIIGRP